MVRGNLESVYNIVSHAFPTADVLCINIVVFSWASWQCSIFWSATHPGEGCWDAAT